MSHAELWRSPELEQRLAALESERAVLATLRAYGRALDDGDEDAWVDCFTDDGRFVVRGGRSERAAIDLRGRAALAAFAAEHTRRPERFHQHCLLDPVVEVETADVARCSARFLVLLQHDGAPRVLAFGRYEDRLSRCGDGRWRLRSREAIVDGTDGALPPISFGRVAGGGSRVE